MKKTLLTFVLLFSAFASIAQAPVICPTNIQVTPLFVTLTYPSAVPNGGFIDKVEFKLTSGPWRTLSLHSQTSATITFNNQNAKLKSSDVAKQIRLIRSGKVVARCTTHQALPVDLIYFKAERVFNRIEFEWQTASEYINDYFELQASIDGRAFETINFITGNGTTNSKTTYNRTLIDSEYVFFRLKQVDYDGQFEIHSVIKVPKDLRGNLLKTFRLNELGVESAYGNIIIEIYTDRTVKKLILKN